MKRAILLVLHMHVDVKLLGSFGLRYATVTRATAYQVHPIGGWVGF